MCCFVTGCGVAVGIGWLWLSFSAASLPQDPSGLGGIDLSMGRFFEPGGKPDRLTGPEGRQAARLMAQL